jgi:RNA polymerase sigma factor (sigma-70 family)
MASGTSGVLYYLRELAGAPAADEPGDGELLRCFAAGRDEAAFRQLVRRHGPMVLGACRRLLGNHHDAEDAFQAAFLILARRAGAIRRPEALGAWLHEVAVRTARRARTREAARRLHERQVPPMPERDFLAGVAWRDLQGVLDEEIGRLPAGLRVPVVLCYLEGRTYEQASKQLRCPPGTLSRRLARARGLLRSRLVRRGLALPAGVLAAALAEGQARAAVPGSLLARTVKAALAGAAGPLGAGTISAPVAALVEGGLRSLARRKATTFLGLVLALACAGAGAALLARERFAGSGSPSPGPAPRQSRQVGPAKDDGQRVTVFGRVLGPDGEPVRGARVFGLDMPPRVIRSRDDFYMVPAGETETDAQGQFRLGVRPPGGELPPAPIHPLPVIFARADGCGVGVYPVTGKAKQGPIVLRLPREQVLRCRFVDANGEPVQGLVVKVASVYPENRGGRVVTAVAPPRPPRSWFPPLKTDAQGRLRVRGIGPGQGVFVEVSDPRFRWQRLDLTEEHSGVEVVHKVDPPGPKFIRGRVTFEDTGKPAAGVVVRMQGQQATTDRQGRFRLSARRMPASGSLLTAEAPAGTAYFGWLGNAPSGQYYVPQPGGKLVSVVEPVQLNIVLRRAVRVRGRVVEAGTDRGIRGARVCFVPSRQPLGAAGSPPVGLTNPVTSGPDGTFSLMALPGPGRLITAADRADYVPVDIGRNQFAHAAVPVGLGPGMDARAVQIPLRRGAVVKVKVTGPDGRPVKGAVLISRLTTRAATLGWGEVTALPVPAEFAPRGCDPDRSYPAIFFQEEKGWGALVRVSGKQAGKPLEVRLRPCGAARARYLTADGRPVAGRLTSGDVRLILAPGDLAFWGAFITHSNIRKDWHTDDRGRITWRGLVPGASYQIQGRAVTVRPGQELDLGDVVIPGAPAPNPKAK